MVTLGAVDGQRFLCGHDERDWFVAAVAKRLGRWFGTMGVSTLLRNPDIYAREHVRHADDATLHLNGWHRVYINAELTLQKSVAYLD